MTTLTPNIAIVGSGPAGCYLAQSLLRALPEAKFTIFDRLVSPFGLIRYGVASDHQHTKAITRQFDRLFRSEQVTFAGDIEIGRDVSLDELRAAYDAVVLATGLTQDRGLGIPGADLAGVVGAGEITRILNSAPGAPTKVPDLGSDVVIIGAGNVALDVLRFLVKDAAGFDASDVSDTALEDYLAHPAERVSLVSRSGPAFAKGDPQMLKELAALPRASYTSAASFATEPQAEASTGTAADAAAAPALDRTQTARVAAYADMVAADREVSPGPAVTLHFGLSPIRVVGEGRVEAVEFAAGTEVVTVPATSVVTAIGFDGDSADVLSALTAQAAETGRLESGLYRTGWAKRGPRGAIPENRACAKSVADEIVADLASGALTISDKRQGFAGLPAKVRDRAVDYDQWLTLDAHEQEQAPEGRVRRKLSNHDQMAAVARRATAS